MRFLSRCFLSAILVCLSFDLHAQLNTAVINGRVVSEISSYADGATILLLNYKDSSIVNSSSANKSGYFQFNALLPGNYLVLVSKAGFERTFSRPFNISAGQVYKAPDVILKISMQNLKEVSITAKKNELESRPGKIIINVQNSLSAQGNSAFDILKESPGVRVDNSNNINLIGRQNALITIDDKPTNLTGEDLVAVLRGIPYNMIDRIELVTSGSAKYDASGGGVINIILKKGNNYGFNGSFTGVAGYGKYYKSNAGVVFNYRTQKFNIFGNYSYTDNKNYHTITTDRIINYNDTVSNYHSDYNSVVKNQVNTFGLGADFFPSSTQTIGFLVNGSVTADHFVKDNNLAIYNQSVLDSTITSNSRLSRSVSRVNYNLNYSGKLDNAGKMITADFNYTINNRSSYEYITNQFYNVAETQYRNPELLQNISPSDIHVWLSRVDFSDPVSKNSKFEAGLKFSDAVSDNTLIFGPYVNHIYTSDPDFSNEFNYTEYINAAYVNYTNKFNKFDLVAGLRAEQTITKGNSVTAGEIVNNNYINLFPQVMLTYKTDDKGNLSLSFNRGIKRPGYEDINPFLYYIDVYDYRAGNPYLKPEYTTNIELTYNYNKIITTTLYSNIVSEAYEFRYFVQDDTTKVNINTPKNFGTIYNYGLRFLTPVIFTNWWDGDFKLDASYQRYVAYPQNGDLNKGTQDVILSSNQNLKISNTIAAEIVGYYETPSFYGISQFKANYYVDAFISKQLFNKKGSLKLSMTDIFNTRRDRYSTNYENLNLAATDKTETQVVKLTFTYRFGKTSLKTTPHRTGNEEDQKRLNNGNEN